MAKKDNKVLIAIIVAIGIGLLIFFPNILQGLTTINPSIEFAGFTWEDSGTEQVGGYEGAGDGSTKLKIEEGFLQMTASAYNREVQRAIRTDVTKIDEILIIYEGHLACYPNNAGSELGAGIWGSEGGSVANFISIGCGIREDPSISKTVQPAIWKFKNNFDGTWSTLQFLGVGDIFVVKGTDEIKGDKTYLDIRTATGGHDGGGGKSLLKVYNVVVKESAFAVCKADEFWQDTNQDGTPQIEECFDLQTIVLNSEEAIKESFEEKFERIEEELEKKNQGLEIDIDKLREELKDTGVDDELQQKIEELQEELERTKDVLEDVITRDKDVIESIEEQEKLKELVEKILYKEVEKKVPLIEEIPLAIWIILGIFIFAIILNIRK